MSSDNDGNSTSYNDNDGDNNVDNDVDNRFSFNNQDFYRDSDVSLLNNPMSDGKIPEDLRKVLIDFSVACLVNQPTDYIDYGVKYFRTIQAKRHVKKTFRNLPIPSTMSLVKVSSKYFGKRERREISKASLCVAYGGEDDENEVEVEETNNRYDRRKSVYALSYDIEDADESEDDQADFERFPKTKEQRERIKNALNRVFMFRPIETEQIDMAISLMTDKRFTPGQYVVKHDQDDIQNFFVIESGKFNAYVNGKHVYSYDNEGSFGEMALLYKTETETDIKAETDCMVWVLDGPSFQRILLKSSAKKRKMYESLLESVPLLKVLKPRELLNLADALVPQHYKKDDVVIKQGDEGNGMYFIEEGRVAVKIEWEKGQGERYIASLQRGAYFGEIALLTNGPRMASIYAETDTKLAFLEKEGFERLLGKCVDLLKRGLKEYHNTNLQPYLSQLESISLQSDKF